mmetsp:Transcript_24628/g.42030  ORF Transcript_24628/g.42030 Transcript_24628/m.42030 type:complete len:426 (-) Transcript_24628:58-1335(-)
MASRTQATIIAPTFMCTVALSNKGTVSSVGSHYEDVRPDIPSTLRGTKNIKGIDCGHSHSIFLDKNGNVSTFGGNQLGQLGIGKPVNFRSKKGITVNIPSCKAILCGDFHNLCVTKEGNVYGFGSNVHGELGQEDQEMYSSPVRLTSLRNVDFVACGQEHSICKTMDNEVFVWGRNSCGQLGVGDAYKKQNTPLKVSGWPDNIVDIKGGRAHTLILTSDKFVYSCGSHETGQLGLGDSDTLTTVGNTLYSGTVQKIEELSNIVRIECGDDFGTCIDENGNLFVFGSNVKGQLGLGDFCDRNVPVEHPLLSNVIDISGKGRHTFVKIADNRIYGFGNNEHCHLGIRTRETRIFVPVRVLEGNENFWVSTSKGEPGKQISMRRLCCNCYTTTTDVKKCARCTRVYYCSRECQISHWANHKVGCTSLL